MDRSIFRYILRYSMKEQVLLLVGTGLSFPFLYMSLDLPKTIVNKAIAGKGIQFPTAILGFELEQVAYLFVLCGLYLALVFVNGGFKYFILVFQGIVGERMLRRLRYELLERVMRFPLPHFRKASSGQIVSMVNAETEPLGGFVGECVVVPAFQGGTLITIIVFMFVQDWILGLAAIALYPIQGYLIPKFQRQVNQLGRNRVRAMRFLSDRIGEIVGGASEIHGHDTSQFELADVSHRLGGIFGIRVNIYRQKFFIKFLNNFLSQLTPFFFLALGGYLVIAGDLTFGSLVAVLAAYKDMASPWKELLDYYQHMQDSKIKYEQIVEQFQPQGMIDEKILSGEPDSARFADVDLVASNVVWGDEEGAKVVDGASLTVRLPAHVALVGHEGGGRDELAKLLARQLMPSGGRIAVDGGNFAELPESVTGRRIAYVGGDAYLGSGTIRDTLVYGLKHRPMRDATYDSHTRARHEIELAESARSGNSTLDINADWVDHAAAGSADAAEFKARIVEVLRQAVLEDDVYQIGLRRTIDPERQADFVSGILKARALLRDRLGNPEVAALVEVFDRDRYNTNASVAENILFGTPVGPAFQIENLSENAFVMRVLDEIGLTADFVREGHRLAEMMVEIFRDLPAGHEFFERFSFISAEDLPEFQATLRRVEATGIDAMPDADRKRLLALPFKVVVARHHIGVIDEAMRDRLLKARLTFAAKLPAEHRTAVQFFDPGTYNAASVVQDNILFGKIASDKAQSADRVGQLVGEIVDALGLRPMILEAGLDFEIGVGGSRLSAAQRQKLALARSLLRRPDLLVVNNAVSVLDGAQQATVFANVRAAQEGRSLIWSETEAERGAQLSRVLTVQHGRTAADGGPRPIEAERPMAEAAGEEVGGLARHVELLAGIPLFGGLDRSKLKLVAFTSERLTYEAGQAVFRQGELGDKAYIVNQGEASVVLETAEGDKTVATIGANELFGELALLRDAKRTATIRAKTELTVLAISKDVFLRLVEEDRQVSFQVVRAIAARLEGTLHEYTRSSALYDPFTSLASYRLFADRYRQSHARKKRAGAKPFLVLFDLAPLIGDQSDIDRTAMASVLREVAVRLKACRRGTDTVAFLSGLEFAVIMDETRGPDEIRALAERIAKSLAQAIDIEHRAIVLGPDFRFSAAPIEDADVERSLEVLRRDGSAVITVRV